MLKLDSIFSAAVEQRASDIHLVVGYPPTLRVDGALQPVGKEPITDADMDAAITVLLSKDDRARFAAALEFDFAFEDKSGQRYRMNLHRERGHSGCAARLIPATIPSMADLGLPEAVQNLITLPHGIVLVTGPTGSGKSTTLASMINAINTDRAATIVTLEDPIEFHFPHAKSVVRQRQLGRDMTSFAEGLKHVLRQDPNIIMVGEMRDLETVALALTAAETGHLVFATLHTYSAAETVDRLIDVFPPHQQDQIRVQLAATLRAIIAQQLLPKVGGGRVAAREVLLATPAVANLIRENKAQQIGHVLETGAKEGMIPFTTDLRRLVREKMVAKEDAERFAVGRSLGDA